jgi:hypothetical protein
MRCPQCQHANREGAKFCGECGAPQASYCPSCGTENRPGAKFCNECGTVLHWPTISLKPYSVVLQLNSYTQDSYLCVPPWERVNLCMQELRATW